MNTRPPGTIAQLVRQSGVVPDAREDLECLSPLPSTSPIGISAPLGPKCHC